MKDWQAEYKNASGDEAIESIRKQLRERLPTINDVQPGEPAGLAPEQIENRWLAAASLASGRQDVELKLVEGLSQSSLMELGHAEQSAVPLPKQILPWMSTEQVARVLKDEQLKLQRELSQEVIAVLKSATYYENYDVAQWLLDQAAQDGVTEANYAILVTYLIRALRGEDESSSRQNLSANNFRGDLPFQSYVSPVVGTGRAVDWLYAHWRADLTPTQRALMLATLAHFDYRLASQAAVGCVAAAKEWNMEVNVAITLALSTERRVAADRAMQWLEHPVREVRLDALKSLTQSYQESFSKPYTLRVPIVYDDSQLPLFTTTNRPVPVESVKSWLDADGIESWYARLLLLSCGQVELDEKIERSQEADTLLPIAAALAKAGRNDEAAMNFYRRVEAIVDYSERALLISILSLVPGDEAKAMRKRVQKNISHAYGSAPF